MEIKLDAEAAGAIASAAIFDSLDQSVRDDIIKQAVQHLLTPPKRDQYSSTLRMSPLQEAFNAALSQAAYKAVQEKVANDPEVSARIQELMGPVVNGVMEEEAARWDNTLSDLIGKALGDWAAEVARSRRD